MPHDDRTINPISQMGKLGARVKNLPKGHMTKQAERDTDQPIRIMRIWGLSLDIHICFFLQSFVLSDTDP